jgi:capsule polysaccharide export protein KpsE/RkpR
MNNKDLDQAQADATEATARLDALKAEIAALPDLIKAEERKARAATDVETVEKHLAEKERLEKRQKALPYLIPQAQIVVLKAKAAVAAVNRERARAELPAATAELTEATAELAKAQTRFTAADKLVKALQTRESGSHSTQQMLLHDAERLSQGQPTMRYFTTQ